MGTATASGPDRARIAAEQAVACPLLEGIDLSGAKGVLVLVTAAKGSLKLSESAPGDESPSTPTPRPMPTSSTVQPYDDSLGRRHPASPSWRRACRAPTRAASRFRGAGRPAHRHDNIAYQMPIAGAAVGAAGGLVGGAASQADYGNMSVPSAGAPTARRPRPRGCTVVGRHGRPGNPGLPA